jgi:hypothetical protein
MQDDGARRRLLRLWRAPSCQRLDDKRMVELPPRGGETFGGSKRMRRARYLASADSSLEVESPRECRCCPAIPTPTCAPARHAGLSTNYCMDHQVSSSHASEADRRLSTVIACWCTINRRTRSCRRSRWRDARLGRLFKSGFEIPVHDDSRRVAESGAWCNDLGGRCHTGEPR